MNATAPKYIVGFTSKNRKAIEGTTMERVP